MSCEYDYDETRPPPCITNFYHTRKVVHITTLDGLIFGDVYIPEELLFHILSFVPPMDLLNLCLVCRRWNRAIKSHRLWSIIYDRVYKKQANPYLPWFVYYCLLTTKCFDTNFIFNYKQFVESRNGESLSTLSTDGYILDYTQSEAQEYSPLTILGTDYIKSRNNHISFCVKYPGVDRYWVSVCDGYLFRYIMAIYKPHIYFNKECGLLFHIESVLISNRNSSFTCYSYRSLWDKQYQLRKGRPLTIPFYPKYLDGFILQTPASTRRRRDQGLAEAKFLFDSIEPSIYDIPMEPDLQCRCTSDSSLSLEVPSCN